jgi:pyruvate dehydrogenase complex dehydrogenase (E1) component
MVPGVFSTTSICDVFKSYGSFRVFCQRPKIAATDYVRAVPESIRAYLPEGRSYTTLGTDGFGRSDTRAALRAFFNVDAASIVKAALHQLSII